MINDTVDTIYLVILHQFDVDTSAMTSAILSTDRIVPTTALGTLYDTSCGELVGMKFFGNLLLRNLLLWLFIYYFL